MPVQMKDEAVKPDAKPIKMVTAAVAARNTIVAGVHDEKGNLVGRKRYMPGELIELPEDEAARHIAAGKLLSPGASQPVIATGTGPAFDPNAKTVIRPE